MEFSEFDDLDRKIIHELQRDARQPADVLADAVNEPVDQVRQRIEELETRGVIEGYHATINYDAAGVQHHYLFRCSARVSQREKLAQQALDQLGVTEVYTLMTGKNNVLVVGVGAEKDDMTGLAFDIDNLGLQIESESLVRQHSLQPFESFRL